MSILFWWRCWSLSYINYGCWFQIYEWIFGMYRSSCHYTIDWSVRRKKKSTRNEIDFFELCSRCYITLAQALHMSLGGAPAGMICEEWEKRCERSREMFRTCRNGKNRNNEGYGSLSRKIRRRKWKTIVIAEKITDFSLNFQGLQLFRSNGLSWSWSYLQRFSSIRYAWRKLPFHSDWMSF